MSKQEVVTEDDIIDFILQTLYLNLDINEMHLERQILSQTKINFSEKQVEHLRELLMTTGMVNNVVGFNKAGFLYLNKSGIALMKKYKSYHHILAADHSRVPHTQILRQDHNTPGQEGNQTDNKHDGDQGANSDYDDMAH
jgi:hypothetical protein